MPLYEYECTKCKHRFERIRKFSDPPLTKCPECGAKIEQLLSAPAVQFKGSGWYVTDYARKGSAAAESSADSKSDSKPDAKPAERSEATSEAKPDSKPDSSKSGARKHHGKK